MNSEPKMQLALMTMEVFKGDIKYKEMKRAETYLHYCISLLRLLR